MKMMIRKGVLICLLLMMFGLAGCPSNKVVFPAITESAAEISSPGKFVWFDLFSTDMTACENFYEALFGWDFRRTNGNNPRVKTIFRQSKPIANMIGRDSEPGNSQWLSYISTENVATTLELVVDNGGEIYREDHVLPDRGTVGALIDPQGAAVALLNSPIGDPVDSRPQPNAWLGSELWTTNAAAAGKFYQAIVGYEVEAMTVHIESKYHALRKNGKRRGGIVTIPWKGMKPEWVPFIAVESVPAIVSKVEGLQGKVLIEPDMDVVEGRLAIIADPSGAVFGIYQIG